MGAALPLAGKTIIITRPKRQAAGISQRLKAMGATVVEFPLIAIEAPANKSLALAQLQTLDTYDYLIFTSRNSVDKALGLLAEDAPEQSMLPLIHSMEVAAVGKRTADALKQRGIEVSIVPDSLFNSEALLGHEALQTVVAKRIAIIRGDAGRNLLRDTLLERGAVVDYIDVYRRVCPVSDLLPLVKCHKQAGIDIILLTSAEGLINLLKLGVGQDWLKQTSLLLGSQRMADVLNDLLDSTIDRSIDKTDNRLDHQGRVLVADDPSDDQMINCLLSWAAGG